MNFKSDIDLSHHLISSCWEKPSRGPVKKCKSGWKVVIALIMSNLNFLFCRSSNSSEYQNIHWLLASVTTKIGIFYLVQGVFLKVPPRKVLSMELSLSTGRLKRTSVLGDFILLRGTNSILRTFYLSKKNTLYNSRPSQDTLPVFVAISLKLWCCCMETKQDQWEVGEVCPKGAWGKIPRPL